METIGIREFRENLAEILLDSSAPIAITRHGETVGYYVPARRKLTKQELDAFDQLAERLDRILAARGISEDEAVQEFKRRRKARVTK
ncbi:MAG: prevent-host-death protein [Candidatus Angelobacter sp. Gp1-AA117]|nr:MAG: prevent-host-death protein [Candidatus Angelobacter sp. Gp1-AA117]